LESAEASGIGEPAAGWGVGGELWTWTGRVKWPSGKPDQIGAACCWDMIALIMQEHLLLGWDWLSLAAVQNNAEK